MYEDAFLRFGRLSHLIQCLGYHPQYLSHFTLTLDFVMHGNGPLRLDIRNYIAVLVRIGGTSQVLRVHWPSSYRLQVVTNVLTW